MPCYHPLLRVAYHPLGHAVDTRVKVIPYTDNAVSEFHKLGFAVEEQTQIPCGKCVGCRLQNSREWADRCMLELEYHQSAYFVTLTYDNDHVPISWYTDEETGETCPAMTLRKRDFQLWMKRVRKAFGSQKIRFIACGEYGDHTFRPHYHAILFGLKLDDLVPNPNFSGDFPYFSSKKLAKTWTACYNGLTEISEGSATSLAGNVVIGDVSWDTCAYVARYIMKKQNGPGAKIYDDANIEHPFSLQSRKPGLARQYYDDHPEMFDYEFINVSTPDGGMKFRPPSYFWDLLEQDDPTRCKALKQIRKEGAESAKEAEMANTSLSYLELLGVKERTKFDKIKKLERSLE